MNFEKFVKNIDVKLESAVVSLNEDASFVKKWKNSVARQWSGDEITPHPKLRTLRDIFLSTAVVAAGVSAYDQMYPPKAEFNAQPNKIVDRNREKFVSLAQEHLKKQGFTVNNQTLSQVYDETPKEELDNVLQQLQQFNQLREGVEVLFKSPTIKQKAGAAFLALMMALEQGASGLAKNAEKAVVRETVPTAVAGAERAAVKTTLADVEAQMAKTAVNTEKSSVSSMLKNAAEKPQTEMSVPAAVGEISGKKDVKATTLPFQAPAKADQKAPTPAPAPAKADAVVTEPIAANGTPKEKVPPKPERKLRGRYAPIPGRRQTDDDDSVYAIPPYGEAIDAGDLITQITPFSKWSSATIQSLKI